LERRDRHCRFPGCDRRHDLHAHHVQHWAKGGATSKGNLVLLCRFHHRLVHEDGFTIHRGRDGTFEFRSPDRRRITEAPRRSYDPTSPRGEPIAA
jgi:HNH endonuclease